ncbi:hypothetical protein LWI28_014177 [Acer negundo]|uniref:Uncharacterized protein n=1 Tax=Acer negundo TaxID=4023 RepID=A0AAD5J5U0_ACENE|nr:hypothetical protein LWI28_014177 [Acer negundo]
MWMCRGVSVQPCCIIDSGILNKKLLLVVEFEAWNGVFWFPGDVEQYGKASYMCENIKNPTEMEEATAATASSNVKMRHEVGH